MLKRLILALLVLAPLGAAQSQELDLSRYGSLARQQIVRNNLELQRQHNYLRMRRRIREQLPAPQRAIIVRRSNFAFSQRASAHQRYYEQSNSRKFYGSSVLVLGSHRVRNSSTRVLPYDYGRSRRLVGRTY